ncbi:hypothetical protein LS48_09350 [Aequorivita aquimaris]|uniref:Curlin n=1 Tax=Aequorivita aquimaris TaxID=1548749 RepID=A0A137RGY3_9FLAO|nr:hypothetical protein [Aequorivita aquimaris]KXN98756.1 hypothetical protein LS48_09350 [Aequorivita aquimaris]
MKKVILGAAALMFCGFAFAQRGGVETPTAPTGAETITNLSVDPNANTGQSTQTGDNNRVQVLQVGTSQSASTYQGNGSGIGGNLALITQVGAIQTTSGVRNDAEVHQMGSENKSITDQQGDYNEALTNQGMNDDGSSNNFAWIRQGTNEQAQDNMAEVNQDGDNNVAKTLQTFDGSSALINQVGDGNMAFSKQNAGANLTGGHQSEIWQQGDENKAFQDQKRGNDGNNSALIAQIGDGNEAQQTQENTGGAAAAQNEAFISQGDGTIASDLTTSIYFGRLTSIDDIQNGSYNPGSTDGRAFQNQLGVGNNAELYQNGDATNGSNYSEQNQTGDDNAAYVIQNLFGNPNGSGNSAWQDQTGNGNQAGIAQNGNTHKAYQFQDGNDNIAMSTQRGECNQVNTHQLGDDNYVQTAQRGMDNGILVVQDGGHSYSVQQNLTDGMPNGGNSVNVLQLNPNGTDPGIICDFPDMDTHTGNYGTPGLVIDDVCPGC